MDSPLASAPGLVAALASLTAFHLFVSVVWLARKRDDYSHLRQTISELGETGSVVAKAVAWISFAPTSVLFCLTLLTMHPFLPETESITQGLLFLSLIGLGYFLAALFPCDPGAPMFGSGRNLVHNIGATLEYLGALAGFDLLHRSLEDSTPWAHLAVASQGVFIAVLIGFLGTVFPNPFRGLSQRIGEFAIFGWLVLAGWTVAHLS